MSNIETELEETPKLERKRLKPYTLRLRPDQLDFLKSLENASSFVREAIDGKIADTERVSNERVIALHEAYEELKEKIPIEEERIQAIKNRISKIDHDIERAEKMISICRDLLDGKIEPNHILQWGGGAYYEIRAEFDGKDKRFGRGDTEEEAIANGKQIGEHGLPTVQGYLEGYITDKKHHTQLLKAHEGRLRDMQAKLEKFKKCIM